MPDELILPKRRKTKRETLSLANCARSLRHYFADDHSKHFTIQSSLLPEPAMKLITIFFALCLSSSAQEFPSRWDELTASDWPKAQEKAAYTCILPIGILEKHGPHVPLGSDLIQVREWSARAAKGEYVVIF